MEDTPVAPLNEISQLPNEPRGGSLVDLESLLILGGFPEPFVSGSEKQANQWCFAYGTRLVEEEIRSLENVKILEGLELLFDSLSEVAGSTISINYLREDLEVSFETVKNWIHIFEKFYSIFRVSPFGPAKIKAIKRVRKLYFWDWSRAISKGARFENLEALHLLWWMHGWKMSREKNWN